MMGDTFTLLFAKRIKFFKKARKGTKKIKNIYCFLKKSPFIRSKDKSVY